MKPAKLLLLVSLLALICVASLIALWRRGHQGPSTETGPSAIKWSYHAGTDPLSGIALAPNGTIHFAASDGIYALSSEGKLLWKAPLPSGPVFAAPMIAPDGTIYGASQSGRLFALDSSGKLTWQSSSVQHKFYTSPALGDGNTLYVTDEYSDLFAFVPGIGPDFVWKHVSYRPSGGKDDILLGDNSYPTGYWRTSPVIGADGTIYLAHQQWLYRIHPRGEILWFVQMGVGQLDYPAIGVDGTVYVEGHNSPWLFAIGPESRQRWSARLSNRVMGSPVMDNAGILYFCDSDFVKAMTPEPRQKWSLLGNCNSGPAIAADGTLYLGMNDQEVRDGHRRSYLAAVTTDGQLKWKIEIHGMVRDATAISPDGTIFFTTDQGYAYAVSDSGSPPMDSSWPRFQHDAQNSGRSTFSR